MQNKNAKPIEPQKLAHDKLKNIPEFSPGQAWIGPKVVLTIYKMRRKRPKLVIAYKAIYELTAPVIYARIGIAVQPQ